MTQREKAVELLKQLNVDKRFVTAFAENGEVTVFDWYSGEAVSEYPGLAEKIAEVENEYGCLVYAVTNECFCFGECFTMLVVSKYDEDWEHCLTRVDDGKYIAFSWVWNTTREECSEFGSVAIDCDFDAIMRIG